LIKLIMTTVFVKFLLFLLILFPNILYSQYFRIDTSIQPLDFVEYHFINEKNHGMRIKNSSIYGEKNTIGIFKYAGTFKVLPRNGIIISTGSVTDAEGPNKSNTSTENYFPGDTDITQLINNKSFDAALLEFDFMSLTDSVSFSFVFASEEYPEYVNRGVSDAFAFIVCNKNTGKKINIAKLPNSDVPITIDQINSDKNAQYFVNNSHINFANTNKSKEEYLFYYENSQLFEFDGFTKLIETGLKIVPYEIYHFKIVIADVGDRKFDSWVLLKGNSFTSCGKKSNPSKKELDNYFKHFENDSVPIFSIQNELKISTSIYFDYNSYGLKNDSYRILNHVTNIMYNSDYKLIIHGFADKKGDEKYNIELSQNRADKVKEYLIKSGINEIRIKSVGMGEFDSQNDTISRKVEFVFQ